MFFELRRYPLKPGMRDAFAKWMDEEIIPYQLSKGMVILGSFVDEANDKYVWIRRFESEEQKEALYAAVYGDDQWKNGYSLTIGDYIDRDNLEVTILKATPHSFMQ